jgi:hypothetical protein
MGRTEIISENYSLFSTPHVLTDPWGKFTDKGKAKAKVYKFSELYRAH